MDYEVRTIPGCPNSGPALELFRQALAAEGEDARKPRVMELTSESEAEAFDFHGPPSFLAHGRDLFTVTDSRAPTSRVYRSSTGLTGHEGLELLRPRVNAALNKKTADAGGFECFHTGWGQAFIAWPDGRADHRGQPDTATSSRRLINRWCPERHPVPR